MVVYGALGCCVLDGFVIEPHWISNDHLLLSEHPSLRVVHISDIHYKGVRSYLVRIVASVNAMAPDVVCFTGDIVEDARYLDEALDILSKINVPLYGVPGNHEYWCGASFDRIGDCFRKTGGGWLVDSSVVTLKGRLVITGRSGTEIDTRRVASEFAMPGRKTEWNPVQTSITGSPALPETIAPSVVEHGNPATIVPGVKRILLTHYPLVVESIKGATYDLILSGHSHGGQVRLPFIGALIVPFGVNGYQMGTYSTPIGPLHVSSGLGTFYMPVRFLCRPEITLIEI